MVTAVTQRLGMQEVHCRLDGYAGMYAGATRVFTRIYPPPTSRKIDLNDFVK